MDAALQPLLALLDRLPSECHHIREEVNQAVRVAELAPELAVVPPRKVLDHVLREVYERCFQEPAGTRPLENLTQRLVKEGQLPPRQEAYASHIRQLGNAGAHQEGAAITPADVRQSLLGLVPIMEWYIERTYPGVLEQPPRPAPESTATALPPATRPDTPVLVVPKGLRAFDANDAAFFLDLLPGPRDQDGLPENLRFWKHRIEERDEPTFTVGVIYGPSGCGKSSLVKAGLLPRLAKHILPVYVESTAGDTEARLMQGVRRRCPDLPADQDPTATLAALRQGIGLGAGQKVLLVLDQFEQWLHVRPGEDKTELAQALRQCDGERIQCVLLVRDDFWLGLSRFMNDLHIGLVQGQNMALVDLFDATHARRVLAAFGRAFGRVAVEPSHDQAAFLDQAIAGLGHEGRVIAVRLALFAEMVKDREWTPATLRKIGGTGGVGVSFLEETFGTRAASPRYRSHQQAVRAVLGALLPEHGGDINGNMQSYAKLLDKSGYAHRAQDFEELLHILDGELRLITPTEPTRTEQGPGSAPAAGEKYYQLTHDYLVQPLEEWLSRKQKETRRGRAQLRLVERAALWVSKPVDRYLPAWWEWLYIRLFTRKRDWTTAQRRMMRREGRFLVLRAAILLVVVLMAAGEGARYRARMQVQNGQAQAGEIVKDLLKYPLSDLEKQVALLAPYSLWGDPLLKGHVQDDAEDSPEHLKASLALLLEGDRTQVEYLRQRLLVAAPEDVMWLTRFLKPVADDASDGAGLREALWAVAKNPAQKGQQLHAACALADYAPNDAGWDGVATDVADDLMSVPPISLSAWIDALFRPADNPGPSHARDLLRGALIAIFHDAARSPGVRVAATKVLASDDTLGFDDLADLLMEADDRQWAWLWRKVLANRDAALARFTQTLDQPLTTDWKDAPLDPAWGMTDPSLVAQVEAASGMVAPRFALCQTLPLAQFDALVAGLKKAGYRLLRFRPYAQRSGAVVQVAAVWTRDGKEAQAFSGLTTSQEATQRDTEMRARGLVPLDVGGYLTAGAGQPEPRYAVLWGPKETESGDVDFYVGVPSAAEAGARTTRDLKGYVPRTLTQVVAGAESWNSAVWWKPNRTLETKEYNSAYREEAYERKLTPSNLQIDLRLGWDPAWGPRRLGGALAADLGAGLGGIPWAALLLSPGDPGPPGVTWSAVWIDSPTAVSEEVHGLDPAAHLARCRALADQGYRPVSLTVADVGAGGLLAGSVWQQPVVTPADKDALAKRQARAAVALLRLGTPERVWPLLEHPAGQPPPRARVFLIHLLAPLAADPALLFQQLEGEHEVSRRRALVLSLGTYPAALRDTAAGQTWRPRLEQWYRDEPDAGLHGVVGWLLRQWKDDQALSAIEKDLTRASLTGQPGGQQQWLINGQGQTMVLVPGPVTFWMGSPGSESGRSASDEALHRVRIPRSFAIGANEVTVRQMLSLLKGYSYDPNHTDGQDGPVNTVMWYDAARYCNLLSQNEGIPPDQWCYLTNDAGQYDAGMRLAPGALEKSGYRLPTEAEWEYACRAGAATSRFYGDADELLGRYAWYSETTKNNRAQKVGQLEPNGLGLFDLYGNAGEWVLDADRPYRWPAYGRPADDQLPDADFLSIKEDDNRLIRGGVFYDGPQDVRSAHRDSQQPSSGDYAIGFRVVRTVH